MTDWHMQLQLLLITTSSPTVNLRVYNEWTLTTDVPNMTESYDPATWKKTQQIRSKSYVDIDTICSWQEKWTHVTWKKFERIWLRGISNASTKPTIHMDQHGIFAIFFNVFMMKYCCWYTHTILQEIWIKNMEHIWFGTTKTMSCTITNSKIRHNYTTLHYTTLHYTTLLDWTSLLNCDRLNYMYTTLQCTALHCICQHDTSHHTTPQHVNGTAQ